MTQKMDFLENTYSENIFNPQQNWQKLINHQIIPQNAKYDENEDFSLQILELLDHATYSNREFNYFYDKFFNHFFPHPAKWIYEPDEIEKIPSDSIIHINQENLKIEWEDIEHFYFQFNNHHYHFFIYCINRSWENKKSFLFIFNQILKYFNFNKTVYQLIPNEDWFWDRDPYFIMSDDKFSAAHQWLGFEYVQPNFFTPESKTPEFLTIEPQYKKIISNQGFISALNQTFIEIPKTQSIITKQAQEWLISMIDEMRSQALQYLKQDNFIQKTIEIRNLFVSLALNMVGDYCVSHNLKKHVPLWQSNRYQDDVLDQKQRIALLDTIFNQADLAIHLTYPY